MKTLISIVLFMASSAVLRAQDSAGNRRQIPDYYLTMHKGKLIEHHGNEHRIVTKDMTLVDATTIHPDGSMDLGSGESRKLKKGEYMTMDGRIRKLKNLGEPKKPKWTTGS